MEEEYQLVMSPLCQSYSGNGKTVQIEIYRGIDTDWSLEVVDEYNNSTVWDDLFPTDQEALDEAMRTIRDDGIDSLIGHPSPSS